MAATCSEDSITVLCSNFNRRLKEAADYLDASSTVIKGFDEGTIDFYTYRCNLAMKVGIVLWLLKLWGGWCSHQKVKIAECMIKSIL